MAREPRPGAAGRLEWSVNVGLVERQRILRGLSRAELSRVAHVDPKTVGSLIRGQRQPNFGTLQALCMALDLPLSEVIAFRDPDTDLTAVEA
jgi:transcriptional regulator with XRE-family HTH domain